MKTVRSGYSIFCYPTRPMTDFRDLTQVGPFPVVAEAPEGAITGNRISKKDLQLPNYYAVQKRLLEARAVLARELRPLFATYTEDLERGVLISADGKYCLLLTDDGTLRGGVMFLKAETVNKILALMEVDRADN